MAAPAFAATATSSVLIAKFDPNRMDLNFPGVGSNSFNFASGSFTQSTSTGTGSASAGNGSITAFGATGNFGGNPNSLVQIIVNSKASLTDSFRVTADTNLPLKLEFGMRASGNVSTVYGSDRWVGGTSSATVRWNVSVSGGASSFSAQGEVSENYGPVFAGGILAPELLRTETGLAFSEFAMVMDLGSGQAGQSYSVSMSAEIFAGSTRLTDGSNSATADFGSSLRWLGLRSATFADGTPYTGALNFTSESGFDYSIPTPGATGLLIAAACLMSARRRR